MDVGVQDQRGHGRRRGGKSGRRDAAQEGPFERRRRGAEATSTCPVWSGARISESEDEMRRGRLQPSRNQLSLSPRLLPPPRLGNFLRPSRGITGTRYGQWSLCPRQAHLAWLTESRSCCKVTNQLGNPTQLLNGSIAASPSSCQPLIAAVQTAGHSVETLFSVSNHHKAFSPEPTAKPALWNATSNPSFMELQLRPDTASDITSKSGRIEVCSEQGRHRQ